MILFDFSDPLPAELNDYPGKLLNEMMIELQDAKRFDRFSLYTLNPYGETPKNLNTFCVPVTLNQIPNEIRKTLWGKDPQQHSKLPSRYHRFAEVFEHLWENEQELKESMNETVNTLANQAKNEQSYSRIIENIEEIAGLEIDRNSRKIKVAILSDMLQNSPQFSHYSNSWVFDNYLSRRTRTLLNMERFAFEIYFIQSCHSLVTAKRRVLQKFWSDYFTSSNASVKFKSLSVDGSSCATEIPTNKEIPELPAVTELPGDKNIMGKLIDHLGIAIKPSSAAEDIASSEKSDVNGVSELTTVTVLPDDENMKDKFTEQGGVAIKPTHVAENITSNEISDDNDASELTAKTKLSNDNDIAEALSKQSSETINPAYVAVQPVTEEQSDDSLISIKKECPTPKIKSMPKLVYPKRARGEALLRYKLKLDRRGNPVNYELYEMDIELKRYEKMFKESAKKYINKLSYEVQIDESCMGGQTTQLAIKFD